VRPTSAADAGRAAAVVGAAAPKDGATGWPHTSYLYTNRAYVLNRYSRIPVTQPQEYESRIPSG